MTEAERTRGFAEWWFRPRALELPLYRALGVPAFRRVLLALTRPGRQQGRRPSSYRLPSHGRAGVEAFSARTRRNEILHLLLVPAPLLLLALDIGGLPVKILCVATIFLNLWPAMLQRYHRVRIAALLRRADRRLGHAD